MANRAFFDSLRTLAFGGIGAAYATVGSSFDNRVRGIRIINNTDADLIFSDDSSDASGKWFVPAFNFVLWDIQSNMNAQFDDKFVLPIGAQIFVKESTTPTLGAVFIEALIEKP